MKTSPLLVSLIALDLLLAGIVCFAPHLWFQIFHGSEVGNEGHSLFLIRMGAQWLGFALVQALALAFWRRDSRWLAAVAGVRLCDVFTDWAYLGAMNESTAIAWVAFVGAGLANLAIAGVLGSRVKAFPSR